MAGANHPDRRSVLIAAVATTAAAVAPAFAQAADGAVAVFEADEPQARAFASGRAARLAVDGDRVRFARTLFGDRRPAKVVAMTRYADFLVLADSAREAGYRAQLVDRAPPDGAALFVWTAERG